MISQVFNLIAGVDEAGRGPLAGPVTVGAVILHPDRPISDIRDSKKLTEKQREILFDEICAKARCWSVGSASVEEIDELNIFHATLLAMQRAVSMLTIKPELVLIDGNSAPKLAYPVRTIIQGDLLEPAISAASIIAKVVRDRLMKELDKQYPQYGFAKHKGYSTAQHLALLAQYGPSAIHRTSFEPVASEIRKRIT